MSATAVELRSGRRGPAVRWLAALWRSPVARALLVSRLLVVSAGVAGAAGARRAAWQTFDPGSVSTHLGAVGNLLAGAAVRWDAIHYLQIAAHGYVGAGDTVFFPLYPFVVHAVGLLVGSDVLAGMAVSIVSFGVALRLLAALTELELGPRAARATVVLIAFAPLSFFFSAVYTESLFLALSVGCLYAARTDRWPLALALGAAAALTRVPGVLLALPLAMMGYGQAPRSARRLAGVVAVPLALSCFLGYLAVRGFGALAPYVDQIGSEHPHLDTGPLSGLVMAARAAGRGVLSLMSGRAPVFAPNIRGALSPGAESVMLFAVLCGDLLAVRAVWRRLPHAYGVYSAAVLALCVWSPVAGQPLASLDRYTLAIFPIWTVAGAWLGQHDRARAAVYVLSAALLAFFTFQFSTWAFIA